VFGLVSAKEVAGLGRAATVVGLVVEIGNRLVVALLGAKLLIKPEVRKPSWVCCFKVDTHLV